MFERVAIPARSRDSSLLGIQRRSHGTPDDSMWAAWVLPRADAGLGKGAGVSRGNCTPVSSSETDQSRGCASTSWELALEVCPVSVRKLDG